MQILYVENHARFARLTAQQFLAAHQVTVIASLAAARETLAHGSFDAILVDYDLDDGKGDELVRELVRELQSELQSELQGPAARPVLIAVSSHQAGNDALVSAGIDAVCSKMQFSNIEAVLAASMS